MRDSIEHRGPDDAGIWWSQDGRVGLGHRRLAVIDLTPGGHQPMADTSGQLRIIFNGEIYNYKELRHELEGAGHSFRTRSDTEVILEAYRAWGSDCLAHLNGMFAFGLYDSLARRLMLARDRVGEKPLFYCHQFGKLIFASELKAMMADPTFPRKLDREALDYYLAFGYVPGEKCILKGVNKLGQGQALMYDLDTDSLRVWRYWQLPEPSPSPAASEKEMVEELEFLLMDSVRLRLIADVPVGILLSGGIDSSLVTGMAVRVSSEPVKTFTVSFPGHGKYDESQYAQIVAEHFGTEHHEMPAEPATVELLPKLARQYDEPIADSSMVPTYLVSRMIREQAKVALAGDGGDELFGGYLSYSMILRQAKIRRFLMPPFRRLVNDLAGRMLPIGFRGRNYLISLCAESPYNVTHVNPYFDKTTRHLLIPALRDRNSKNAGPEAYRASFCKEGHSLLRQATETDFQTTLADAYLVKVDRASMLNSLEIRNPWLDHRIVEFAFRLVPDDLKANERERKILPRRLAAKLLPSSLDLTRKQGFSIPLASWLRGEWGTWFGDILKGMDSQFFNPKVIHDLIEGQRRGRSNAQRLFALVMLELWRREYQISL
jgi:asparagine synthase (glutamine-hydrolysing)